MVQDLIICTNLASLGKNIGYEQDGNGSGFSRPVLVVKKFNNQMF